MCKDTQNVIELENISHWYGSRQALDSVSLIIKRNQTVGLIGQNGAGKSTLLKIIATIIPKLDGYKKFPESIGYLPEVPALYEEMKVRDQLMFIGRLNDLSKKEVSEKLDKMIDEFGLSEVANIKCSKLSKGYKQRVGLLLAFIHTPEVVILDEPTAGLDPKQSEATRAIISKLSTQCTVILSSHNLREAQELCGHIVVLDHGRVIESGTKEKLSGKIVDSRRIRAKLKYRGSGVESESNQETNLGAGDLKKNDPTHALKKDELIEKLKFIINKIPGFNEIEELKLDDNLEISVAFTIAKSETEEGAFTSMSFTDNDFAIVSFTEDEVSVDEIFMTLISKEQAKESG